MNRKERRAFAKQMAKQVCSEKKITSKVKRKHLEKMFFTLTMPKGPKHELATSTEESEPGAAAPTPASSGEVSDQSGAIVIIGDPIVDAPNEVERIESAHPDGVQT